MRVKFSVIFRGVYLLLLANCVISCRSSEKGLSTPTTGKATVFADETFKPVLDAELQVFHSLYKYAEVTVQYKTETEAFNDLFHDSVKMIITSRPLKESEMEYFKEKNLFPQNLKIAVDGLALIINKNNLDSLLSIKTIKDILAGRINNWKQINPKSSLGEARMVFDNKSSSTLRFVLDSLCPDTLFSDRHTAVVSNKDVIDAVVKNENLIGVIGVSWISDRDDSTQLSFLSKIRVVAISRNDHPTHENSYQPFQAYIANGWYALARNIYVVNIEPRTGLSTGFASFLASERGQRIILKAGILPATQPYRIIEVNDNY